MAAATILFAATRSTSQPATKPEVTAVRAPVAIAAAATSSGRPRATWRYSTRNGPIRPLPKKFTNTPAWMNQTSRGRCGSRLRVYDRSASIGRKSVTFVSREREAALAGHHLEARDRHEHAAGHDLAHAAPHRRRLADAGRCRRPPQRGIARAARLARAGHHRQRRR